MNRRDTVLALLSLGAVPLAASAQQARKISRVGLIFTTSPVSEMAGPDPVHPAARAFVHELRRLGYVEGRNLVFEPRSAEGKFERFKEILEALVSLKSDVIVTVGDPMTQRAKEVTTTVPIVMAASFDPVGAGVVASLARPGRNITGLTVLASPEIEAKRVQLLKEAFPKISRVAFLGMKTDWENLFGTSIQAAARGLGLTLLLAEHTPNEYTAAFGMIIRERPDALLVAHSAPNFAHRRPIADFATKNRLPVLYPFREFADAGGLMSFGVNVPDLLRRAAGYVDKILKGAKPSDLPVEQPIKFELVINLKTMKALGLTIPPSLLLSADEVIE